MGSCLARLVMISLLTHQHYEGLGAHQSRGCPRHCRQNHLGSKCLHPEAEQDAQRSSAQPSTSQPSTPSLQPSTAKRSIAQLARHGTAGQGRSQGARSSEGSALVVRDGWRAEAWPCQAGPPAPALRSMLEAREQSYSGSPRNVGPPGQEPQRQEDEGHEPERLAPGPPRPATAMGLGAAEQRHEEGREKPKKGLLCHQPCTARAQRRGPP